MRIDLEIKFILYIKFMCRDKFLVIKDNIGKYFIRVLLNIVIICSLSFI